MSNLKTAKDIVASLDAEEMTAFHKWFLERYAEQWDAEMEKALADGVFDEMIEAAIAEDDAGKTEGGAIGVKF